MSDYVRVKVKDTGHKLSLRGSTVDANPDAYLVLNGQAATDHVGAPLPAEHAAPKSLSSSNGQKATTEKKES